MQYALVTGASGGIGRGVVRALEKRGLTVYGMSRGIEGERALRCDVTDEAAVRRAVDNMLRETGRIDLLVNCAGFGISGAVEFTKPEEAKAQLEVNLFGMDNVIRAVLPAMRAQGSGRIVNVSSVAAIAPIPFQAWYSASKAAVNALTMALANEVRPFGIRVFAVLPGDIHTGFTAARRKSSTGDDVYGGRIARSVSKMEKDERGGMDSDRAGELVAAAAVRRHPKPLTCIPALYKACALLIKLLPCRWVERILMLLYGC